MRATRHKVALAGAVGAVLVLSGCTAASTGGGDTSTTDLNEVEYKGTISLVNKFSDPSVSEYFPEMAKEFEAEHPDVTVEVQQESDQGYKDKIKVLASSNSIPDIYFAWPGSYAKQFVDAGLALDLTSVIGEGTEWNESLAAGAVGAGVYDGKNYGVPLDLDAKFMFYNKKVFEDNGVSVPTTFDELLGVCKALKAKGITPVNFGNKDGWPGLHYVTQLNAYNVPAATLDQDYSSDEPAYTDPGYVTALSEFQQIISECTDTGKTGNGIDHTDAQVGFADGKSAMMYLESLEIGLLKDTQLDEDGIGMFPLPAPADAAGDLGALVGAPDLLLVNSKSENPALAVAFLKFIVSKQGAAKMPELMSGYPSPVKDSLDPDTTDPETVEAMDLLAQASSLAIWLDTVTDPQVAQAYLAGGEALVGGTSTPEDVMESVQQAAAGS
ncbi:MAG: extracellular solute-binding protein [Microbacterium sp.]|uniref:ABC transporter substrate-binding protein n=1 Tax=Microbacterium sp. TaxID=51671 RepID=UPI0039E6C35E